MNYLKRLFYILMIVSLFSCSKKEEFDSFDYTFAGSFSSVYSIKFTNHDTVYFREHWDNDYDEEINTLKSKRNYISMLDKTQINTLKKLLRDIQFEQLKDEYFEDYLDGSSYSIFIKRNGFEKNILVHSHKAPKKLDSLSRWIYNLKKGLNYTEIKKNIEFTSFKVYELPPPPPPPKK